MRLEGGTEGGRSGLALHQSPLSGPGTGRLIHFTSRDAMNIDGCGPSVLAQLTAAGW